jgi:hypothetical protein
VQLQFLFVGQSLPQIEHPLSEMHMTRCASDFTLFQILEYLHGHYEIFWGYNPRPSIKFNSAVNLEVNK